MKNHQLHTKFAPAERLSESEIKPQIELFNNEEILNNFLSKIPAVFLIVNECRQIVYLNEGAIQFTGLQEVGMALGKRPGELFGCVHASEEEGGCGTSEACTWCGAVKAVLTAQKGLPSIEECHLILGPEENAYDLRVWASPLNVNGDKFIAVTIQDISHEKRRIILERVFFHDILNIITGLYASIQLLQKDMNLIDQKAILKRTDKLIRRLTEEIQSQRILNEAENNLLHLNCIQFNSEDFLTEVIELYRNNHNNENKYITIDPESESVELTSDRTLLRRVVGNMLINALEATSHGDTITLGCNLNNGDINFWVHNPGFIPKEVQMQIFKRSYSTKGPNRGIGTYSMKLLSSFLKGSVTFTSSCEAGTIFKACYPKNLTI